MYLTTEYWELVERCTIFGGSFNKARLNGIRGNVDINNCYLDFPNIISKKGLNRL